MRRSIETASLVGLALLLASPVQAERPGKGRSLVLVGIGGHSGEFGSSVGAGYGRFESDELGGSIAYYRFLGDLWTLGISGGYHTGELRIDENNPNGTPLSTERFDTHSFTVRVGGDRYAFIDDEVALYAGPGVFLTQGRAKEALTVKPPATGGRASDGPYTTEVGFNGRIGMYARVGRGKALFGQIGQNLSRSSAKDGTGKVSWWSSKHEGAVGLAFDF